MYRVAQGRAWSEYSSTEAITHKTAAQCPPQEASHIRFAPIDSLNASTVTSSRGSMKPVVKIAGGRGLFSRREGLGKDERVMGNMDMV